MAKQVMASVPGGDYMGEKEPLLGDSQSGSSLPEEEELEVFEVKQKGSGNIATFFNFAKASIGSGSFALPVGILQCGVLLGSFGMVFLGLLSVYTMQVMLECKRFVTHNMSPEKRRSLNYTQLGRAAMGQFGKWAVDISVLGCNLGVCAGYMIFISSNLQWAFSCFSFQANNFQCFTTWEIYAMILPILIILTYLPSFKWLAFAAYVGAVFLAIAMIVVYVFGGQVHVFCAVDGVNDQSVEYLPSTWSGVAIWFGVTAFLFCVHSMVIPLESQMKHPKNMPCLLDLACLVVVGVNLPFAVYGYLLFGKLTQGYVFENLPGGWFNDIVRVFLSLELTLTFPIVFKPATEVAEEILSNFLMLIAKHTNLSNHFHEVYLSNHFSYRVQRTVMICILRTFLVLISWAVAVGVPRFEICLALVGGLATSILAFILPPLFHLMLKWRYTPIWRRLFHLVILIFGIAATGIATGVNLYQAIEHPGTSTNCTQLAAQCDITNATSTQHCFGY